MKRFALLLASTAFVTPALAADVVYEEPAAPIVELAPAYTWTGFYVGGQAGAAFNSDAGDVRFNPATGTVQQGTAFSGGSGSSNDAAFIGGVHVGYDYQINNFIVGAVADINYIDASSDNAFAITTPAGTDAFGVSQNIDYVGTVRAKVGVAMDRFAVYATGGFAYADTSVDFVTPQNLRATNGFVRTVDSSSDDTGYAVGGGVDYLVTQNFSLGLEYLYTDLGDSDLNVTYLDPTGRTAGFTTTSSSDLDFHTVWAKASFRFN